MGEKLGKESAEQTHHIPGGLQHYWQGVQLTARITPSLLVSFVGFLVSIELFLAFSEVPSMKMASYLLFFGSLLLVAAQHWDKSIAVSVLLFSIFFGVYLGSVASRYPGLIKEPMPYLFTDVFRLIAKGSTTMIVSMAVTRLLWIVSRSLYIRLRGPAIG